MALTHYGGGWNCPRAPHETTQSMKIAFFVRFRVERVDKFSFFY
jgi:hypothetical protein